jgi:hypothetical protein
MNFSEIFDKALSSALETIRQGRFQLQSEKDIQALVSHKAFVLLENRGLSPKVHAEPTRAGLKPDLVFGDDEVFVEIKLSRPGTGGYTEATAKWGEDVGKLRKYKSKWPSARCVFVAVDEGGYHSRSSSKNFFNPAGHGLHGTWMPLAANSYYLAAEVG